MWEPGSARWTGIGEGEPGVQGAEEKCDPIQWVLISETQQKFDNVVEVENERNKDHRKVRGLR